MKTIIFKTVCVSFFLCVFFSIHAQEGCYEVGHNANDNNTGMSVFTTSAGGVFLVGYASDYAQSAPNLYAVNFAPNGDTLWARVLGGLSWDSGYDGIETSDGGFLAVGSTQSFGTFVYDFYVVRFNAQGDTLWTRVIDGAGDNRNDEAHAVVQTPDGGFAIAGYSYVHGGFHQNAYVVKLDVSGNMMWTSTVGGGQGEIAEDIILTKDNGLVVVGGSGSYSVANSDMYVYKLDENGNLLWTRTIGGSRSDYAYAVAETNDGHLVVAGATNSYGEGAAGTWEATDAYIVMLDADGDTVWTRTVGGDNYEEIRDVIISSDGYIMAAGFSRTYGLGFMDAYVIKMNLQGDLIWAKTFGNSEVNMAFGITEIDQGSFLLTGRTHYAAYGRDVFMAWLDSDGNSCCLSGSGGEINSGGIIGAGGIAGTGGAIIDSGGEIGVFFKKDTLCLGLTFVPILEKSEPLKIYPNPTSDILNISIDSHSDEPFKISIFTIMGQRVRQETIASHETLSMDVSSMQKGVYIIKIQRRHKLYTGKIVVN